ncbi:MAG: glycosyltransferase family 1 protein [Nitrospira sp. NTP1]|nr:glycosyltransferase family 1 protein [Nitrospira sp. NTP1]
MSREIGCYSAMANRVRMTGNHVIIMPAKQTILFVHGVTEIGGAERELLLYVERLPGMGYRPVVVCPAQGALVSRLENAEVRVCEAPFPPWRKVSSVLYRTAAVRTLRTVIEREQPALIHVNDMWWVPQTLRAASGLGLPIVAHVRQEIESPKVSRYELAQADLVMAISHQVRKSLVAGGVPSERVVTLYGGLDLSNLPVCIEGKDLRRRLEISDDTLVLGTVANLFPRKGYEVMLRALSVIRSSCPKTEYLIVGTGDSTFERRLRRTVREQGLERVVHFLGFQEAVYPCLAAMDLYVHPALMEGFGIAVLEAMALHKPVVATRTGGVPEIVLEDQTGVLVDPGDADSLAHAVLKVLNNPKWRAEMGEAGRARVEAAFTVSSMMEGLVSAYDRQLSRMAS